MHPFEVKLTYLAGGTWATVPFELGHDELGDTVDAVHRLAREIRELFSELGLQEPQPIPVLSVPHQVAQKLHACTAPGSERAHDLVDLQLLVNNEEIDLGQTAEICHRLFTSRRAHSWPPALGPRPDWTTLYVAAADGVDALGSIHEATEWADDLITKIDEASPTRLKPPGGSGQ